MVGRTRTGVVPPMVSVSLELDPEPVSVTVSVVESVTARLAAVMSPPEIAMFGVIAVLNSKPAGAFRTSVPPPISPLPLPGSAMTIEPRLVQTGVAAFAAVSAEILPPPLAGVTVTAASALLARVKEAATRTRRRKSDVAGILIS